jgi:hypothetical protein
MQNTQMSKAENLFHLFLKHFVVEFFLLAFFAAVRVQLVDRLCVNLHLKLFAFAHCSVHREGRLGPFGCFGWLDADSP